MANQKKKDYVQALSDRLKDRLNFVLVENGGLTVSQIDSLRDKLILQSVHLQVIKNRLFYLALKQSDTHSSVADRMQQQLKGPLLVALIDKNFPEIGKIVLDFKTENKSVVIRSGFLAGDYLDSTQVIEIAKLPSQEQLLIIIAKGISTPATRIASGVKEVMQKLARGIVASAKN